MITSERRVVDSTMRARHDMSERRVCRVLGFERTALRYTPTRPLTDASLRAKLRELAAAYPAGACRACTGGCSARGSA